MLGHSTRRALIVSAAATGVAAVVVIVLALVSGVGSLAHAFAHVQPHWIVDLAVAEALTIPFYLLAYRAVLGFGRRPPRLPLVVMLVIAGFGPFALRGGFGQDQQALRSLDSDPDSARLRILALSALEWVVLAPAACIASIALLITGSRAMGSMLWPWAVITPVGLAFGLWFTAPEREHRWVRRGPTGAFARGFDALGIVHELLRHPLAGWQAWLGTAGYWVCDIAALYAACRLFGLRLNAGEVIVAYGTGYVLTRRALPLAGAGITEFLLTYALHWIGEPLGAALAAVVAYRLFNFGLAATPALLAHHQLDRWVSRARAR